MVTNPSPYRNPSGFSAQGLSEEQLSEAAQFFCTNLERLLNANLDALTEVGLPLPLPLPLPLNSRKRGPVMLMYLY